jgi:hypothetical protein
MKVFKNFWKEKKREMTVEAFDTIVENKLENNKREIAIAAGVAAGLVILGCLYMRHSSKQSQTVIYIIK